MSEVRKYPDNLSEEADLTTFDLQKSNKKLPTELEGLSMEDVERLKNQYYFELMRLQSPDAKNERDKDRVIALARVIISCLEQIHKTDNDDDDDEPKGERSSGFKKSMKKGLYKRLGGCLACGGGTMGTPSRHDAPVELHHIVPRLYGGDDIASNALLVCRDCHVEIH